MKNIELYTHCLESAKASSSLYKGSADDRIGLLSFMDANRWFGREPEYIGDQVMVRLTKDNENQLERWLRAYGLSTEEKIDILLSDHYALFPRTCHTIEGFFRDSVDGNWKSASALQMIDYILATCKDLSKEFQDFSDTELHHLFQASSSFLTLRSLGLMKEVCELAHPKFMKTWNYEPLPVDERRPDVSAYTAAFCMDFCYYLFNDQSFLQNHLIEKARTNAHASSCLLFMATHFYTGIRASDMCRLPYPVSSLTSPEKALEVLDHEDRGREAAALAESWASQINMLGMKPNKTRRFSGMPQITVFIPDELKVPVGIMLACSMLHYKDGRPLMSGPVLPADVKKLFGQGGVDLLEGHSFSTRRANKAYLQGIMVCAGSQDGAALPFHLATLARSHKGDLRSLANTTDIYLRDQNFAGVLPDLALMHVFRRGPFSWLLVVLLEKLDKEAFRSMSLQGQTELLASFGLSPIQAEHLAQAVISAGEMVSELIAMAFCGPLPARERLEYCFDQIEKSLIKSRSERSACLLAQAGQSCIDKHRGSCMGCRFEIPVKVYVHCLMKEYIRISNKIKAIADEEDPEKKRLDAIFKKGIRPAIEELVEVYANRCPVWKQDPVWAIIRKGVKEADDV